MHIEGRCKKRTRTNQGYRSHILGVPSIHTQKTCHSRIVLTMTPHDHTRTCRPTVQRAAGIPTAHRVKDISAKPLQVVLSLRVEIGRVSVRDSKLCVCVFMLVRARIRITADDAIASSAELSKMKSIIQTRSSHFGKRST